MELTLNERWLQFAYVNSKGKLTKTALTFPFHVSLHVDDELPIVIDGKTYMFYCTATEIKTNNDGTFDEIYVVGTNNQ